MTDYSPDRIAGLVFAAVANTTAGALTYDVQIGGKQVRLTVEVVDPDAEPTKRVLGSLTRTSIEPGVSMFTGNGFNIVRSEGDVDGKAVLLCGQLNPSEVKNLAKMWLAAAEAAESEAAVCAAFRKTGTSDEALALFLELVRRERNHS